MPDPVHAVPASRSSIGHDDGSASVSRETRDRLAAYVSMLRRWNSRIQLTKLDLTADPAPIHDSLALNQYIPVTTSNALDIGSGNGLPAIPLSIAFGIPYTLVESDRRKAAFLREVARELACPITIAAQRIEDMPAHTYDLVTAQAFGRLSKLLGHAFAHQAAGTVCLFPKGQNAPQELSEAQRDWHFESVCHPARTGYVVQVRSIVPLDRAEA